MGVITFDGDGTLWDISNVIQRALETVIGAIKVRYPGVLIEIEEFHRSWNRVLESNPEMSLYDVRRLSINEVLKEHGIFSPDFGDELFELYLRVRHSELDVYPDTIPVLERLNRSYRIGLITNGNTRFENYPVARYLDFVVRASDVGVSKPDRRIFDEAIKLSGCSKDALLHVGDSIKEDYFGAINAGINALWLNRENLPVPEGVKSIGSLLDLLEILQLK